MTRLVLHLNQALDGLIIVKIAYIALPFFHPWEMLQKGNSTKIVTKVQLVCVVCRVILIVTP